MLETVLMYFFLPTPSARRATPCAAGCSIISTHALREEGDFVILICGLCILPFLPTPSARRATSLCAAMRLKKPYFYPRPPRGGRRQAASAWLHPWPDFYPRPPRGGRHNSFNYSKPSKTFLPTPSARRATTIVRRVRSPKWHFYPRPPRGGRHRKPVFRL